MKRSSSILIFLILALAILAYAGLTRLTDVLASRISQKLKVGVSIDSLGIFPNKITVKKIQIDNPFGYSLPKAFSASEIVIRAPITRYLKEAVVINEITIDGIYLGLEFDSPTSTKGNWSVIMNNLKTSLDQTKQENSRKTVMIKRLILTNIQTQLLFHGEAKVRNLPLIDKMQFTDISSSGGVPTDQLMNNVLVEMLKSIFIKQHLKNMLESIFESPVKAAETIMKPLEKLIP